MSAFYYLGFPNEETWPGVTKLSYYDKLKEGFYAFSAIRSAQGINTLESLINEARNNIDSQAFDLLHKLLTLNPDRRISAS